MKYLTYLEKVETIICNAVKGAFPRQWDEDYISLELCKQFQKQLSSETIEGLTYPLHIEWDAFKLTGNPETLYGDIAILVNYQAWEGETIKGISFFEAKKIDRHANKYPAYKESQLIKQTNNLKRANVLLYSHIKITEFEDNLRFQSFSSGSYPKSCTAFTHALSVQTDIVLQVGKNNKSLHKFGLPLSQQICRNLRGMDLDTNPKIIDEVIKWSNKNNGGVKYLIIASVSENEKPEKLKPNLEKFTPLEK